ncbi:hypothetical protein BO71DRAFT_314310, partial [Aspergillus ellipticus CBS 707.79]
HLQDDDYPYACLLTSPKVWGRVFNPVSFWYLYSANKQLTAMILEVNNNFGERRMYLLGSPPGTPDDAGIADPGDLSPTKPHRFTSRWPKDFHVSPFFPREGMTYTISTADPLLPCAQGCEQPIDSRIVLISSADRVQLIASIRSEGSAIRPAALSAYGRYRLLLSWGWVGMITEPRIFFQAAILHLWRKLKVWYLPEPLDETISRRANAMECVFETFFRGYLRYLVENSARALTVRYHAAGLDRPVEIMQSPSARQISGEPADRVVEFRALRPDFYTSFVGRALPAEAVFGALAESSLLRVSRMDLLQEICGEPKSLLGKVQLSFSDGVLYQIINWTRKGTEESAGLSAMDYYVLTCCSHAEQRNYQNNLLQLLLCPYIAFGSVGALQAEVFVAKLALLWALLKLSSFLVTLVHV